MRDRSCCFCISKWDLHKAAWRRKRNSFSQCSREKKRRGGGGRRKQKIFTKAQIHFIGIFISDTLHHLIVQPWSWCCLQTLLARIHFFRKSNTATLVGRSDILKSPSFYWLVMIVFLHNSPIADDTQGFESWDLHVYEDKFLGSGKYSAQSGQFK